MILSTVNANVNVHLKHGLTRISGADSESVAAANLSTEIVDPRRHQQLAA